MKFCWSLSFTSARHVWLNMLNTLAFSRLSSDLRGHAWFHCTVKWRSNSIATASLLWPDSLSAVKVLNQTIPTGLIAARKRLSRWKCRAAGVLLQIWVISDKHTHEHTATHARAAHILFMIHLITASCAWRRFSSMLHKQNKGAGFVQLHQTDRGMNKR